MSARVFSYVIARPWDTELSDCLCIYAYGSEVHYGTMQSAKDLLDHVLQISPGKDYSIYRVNYKKVIVKENS